MKHHTPEEFARRLRDYLKEKDPLLLKKFEESETIYISEEEKKDLEGKEKNKCQTKK